MDGRALNAVFSVLVAGLTAAHTASASAGGGAEVYLTKDLELREHVENFQCSDKIYIYGLFEGLEQGEHRAEVVWINPGGRPQDRASHRFFAGDSTQMVWFWLKLRPGTGGRFLSAIDPSAGMEEFIGFWNVKFFLDGELVAERSFFVSC